MRIQNYQLFKFILYSYLLIATVGPLSCKKSEKVPALNVEKPVSNLPAGEFESVPTFTDDFKTVNTSIWDFRSDNAGGWACRAENVNVETINDETFLNLNFTKDLNGVFVGAGLKSKEKLGYGYYEAKMKLYAGSGGLHQSWWMIGPTLEIDGMEVDSDSTIYRGQKITGNYHRISPNKKAGVFPFTYEPKTKVDITKWFIIGWERSATAISWYITTNVENPASKPQLMKRYLLTDGDVFASQHILLSAKPHDPYAYLNGYGSVKGVENPLPGAKMVVDWVKFYPRRSDNKINLISNASFEYDNLKIDTDPASAYVPAEWFVTTTNKTAKNCFIEKTTPFSGISKLVHYNKSIPYITNNWQNLNRIPNDTYSLKAWVKSSGGQNKAVMRVKNFAGSNVMEVNIPTSVEWVQVEINNIIVKDNNVVIEFYSDAHAAEWINVDNVEFHK